MAEAMNFSNVWNAEPETGRVDTAAAKITLTPAEYEKYVDLCERPRPVPAAVKAAFAKLKR